MRKFSIITFVLLILISTSHAEEKEPITLGGLFSLTGFGAVAGEGEMLAIRMAVEEINAAGGVLGRPLKVIFEDNQSDFNETATAFKKLVSVDRIPIVFGPNWAEFAEIVAPVAQSKQVVMLSSTGYTKDLVHNGDYIFTLMPAHSYNIRPLAQAIVDGKHKKIAVLTSINSFYELITDETVDYLKNKGVKIWKKFSINPDDIDYRTVITRLKDENIDALIVYLLEGGRTETFLRQARDLNLKTKMYAGPSITYDEAILANKSIANGVTYFDFNVPSESSFLERYKKQYNKEPQLGTGKAYDSVFIAKKAIEECGLKPEEIKRCISTMKYNGVTGPISFDKDGNFVGQTKITGIFEVINGEFVETQSAAG